MNQCTKCHEKAIIYQKYSGMHLCRSHFDEDVHRKVRESLRQTKLFGRSARIAFGLRGGKDSLTLLYILKNLFGRRRDIDFCAIIIEEEGGGSSLKEKAKKLAKRQDIPYIVKTVRPSDKEISTDASMSHDISPAQKMEILKNAAQEIGADILATGHNLDDEALSVFMNYLQGDIEHLLQFFVSPGVPSQIPWIKPLQRIPDKEIRLYAIMHCLYSPECDASPFSKTTETVMKRYLNDFDSRHPGTKYSLLAGRERIFMMQDKALFGGKAFK
jgi:tRNA(Ile)-lysidine synthase TilS/MesJ